MPCVSILKELLEDYQPRDIDTAEIQTLNANEICAGHGDDRDLTHANSVRDISNYLDSASAICGGIRRVGFDRH